MWLVSGLRNKVRYSNLFMSLNWESKMCFVEASQTPAAVEDNDWLSSALYQQTIQKAENYTQRQKL